MTGPATSAAEALTLARRQYTDADNMTDQFAALSVLVNADGEAGGEVTAELGPVVARQGVEELGVEGEFHGASAIEG